MLRLFINDTLLNTAGTCAVDTGNLLIKVQELPILLKSTYNCRLNSTLPHAF